MDFGSLGLRSPSFLHFDQTSAAGREGSSLPLLFSSLTSRILFRSTESSTRPAESHPLMEKRRLSFRFPESTPDSLSGNKGSLDTCDGFITVLGPSIHFSGIMRPKQLAQGKCGLLSIWMLLASGWLFSGKLLTGHFVSFLYMLSLSLQILTSLWHQSIFSSWVNKCLGLHGWNQCVLSSFCCHSWLRRGGESQWMGKPCFYNGVCRLRSISSWKVTSSALLNATWSHHGS